MEDIYTNLQKLTDHKMETGYMPGTLYLLHNLEQKQKQKQREEISYCSEIWLFLLLYKNILMVKYPNIRSIVCL